MHIHTCICIYISLSLSIYIYIYRERERDVYVYTHIHICLYMYVKRTHIEFDVILYAIIQHAMIPGSSQFYQVIVRQAKLYQVLFRQFNFYRVLYGSSSSTKLYTAIFERGTFAPNIPCVRFRQTKFYNLHTV